MIGHHIHAPHKKLRVHDPVIEGQGLVHDLPAGGGFAREINRLKASDIDEAAKLASVLRKLGYVMGILQQNPEAYLKAGKTEQDDAEVARIEALIEERKNAKKNKDWAKADAVRNELQGMGIIIEDGPNGTTWRRK